MTALMGLSARLRLSRLMLVTDTRGGGPGFGEFCADVLGAGVDVLQVREPGLGADRLAAALEMARSVALRLGRLVVVHGDAALAAAFGADALQLRAAADVAGAKAMQHEYALVGLATHDEAGLAAAAGNPAVSYVTVGPVFGGGAHPRYRLPGLDLVRLAAERLPVADATATPWFAIGGIGGDNLEDVLAAGARRVVLTADAYRGRAPAEAVREVGDRLRAAWQHDGALDGYGLRVLGGPGGASRP